MKHAREDYNRIQDPAGLIPADEPVFLLRGQDLLAPDTIRFWAKALRMFDSEKLGMAELAENWAIEMGNWQNTHKAKYPDMPLHDSREGMDSPQATILGAMDKALENGKF